MLLREMTSSALAHSFKRFAQCAVAGLALAGLAACGGGGSSTPAETTPDPEPTPCPQGQVRVDGQCRAEIPIRSPEQQQYLAVSVDYLESDPPREPPNKRAWAYGVGANASAAEEEAKTQCDRLLGNSCQYTSDASNDGCSAIALSECDDDCPVPYLAIAFSGGLVPLSRQDAERLVIGSCRQASSRACSIAMSDTGQPAVNLSQN